MFLPFYLFYGWLWYQDNYKCCFRPAAEQTAGRRSRSPGALTSSLREGVHVASSTPHPRPTSPEGKSSTKSPSIVELPAQVSWEVAPSFRVDLLPCPSEDTRCNKAFVKWSRGEFALLLSLFPLLHFTFLLSRSLPSCLLLLFAPVCIFPLFRLCYLIFALFYTNGINFFIRCSSGGLGNDFKMYAALLKFFIF